MGKEKQKKLTTLDGWAMGTGAMIGATVFVASGLMAGVAGPASSLSFVIAAAVTLIIASCYCEISSAFPRSGGAYIYPKETMGKAGGVCILSYGMGLLRGAGTRLGSIGTDVCLLCRVDAESDWSRTSGWDKCICNSDDTGIWNCKYDRYSTWQRDPAGIYFCSHCSLAYFHHMGRGECR